MEKEPVVLDPHVPAWYEIGATPHPYTLIVRMHADAFSELLRINFHKARIVSYYREQFNLGPFVNPSEDMWGFNACIRTGETKESWHEFRCVLPDDNDGQFATKMRCIRITLSIIFNFLSIYEGRTSSTQPQLLTIGHMRVEHDLGGGGLQATILPAMCEWLQQQPDESQLKEVELLMMGVDTQLFPEGNGFLRYRSDFKAHCRKPWWINLSVPGNACGLDPDRYYPQPEGYDLLPHNVDSGIQQITLLMGLASLCDLARKNS